MDVDGDWLLVPGNDHGADAPLVLPRVSGSTLPRGLGAACRSVSVDFAEEEWTVVDDASAPNSRIETCHAGATSAMSATDARETDFEWRFIERPFRAQDSQKSLPVRPKSPVGSVSRKEESDSVAKFDAALQEWAVVESEPFVHVRSALAMWRSLARRRPILTRVLLWTWLILVVLGELATTIWWLRNLDGRSFILLVLPLGVGLSVALSLLPPEQVVATAGSLILATLPALPAYSAVLLMGEAPYHWGALHWPTLAAIGILHSATAMLAALRSDAPSDLLSAMLLSLEAAQRVARGACIVAAWTYTALMLHAGAGRLAFFWHRSSADAAICDVAARDSGLLASSAAPAFSLDPWSSDRDVALGLHLLGLVCAETRKRTRAALGDDLLPLLLGVERANRLTLQSLLRSHGRRALRKAVRHLPSLRRYSPPAPVVAVVVALRRTAPILLPVLALAPMCLNATGRASQLLLFVACISLLAAMIMVAAREWRSMPDSPLRRLPLLMPSLSARKRLWLGNVLVAAERVAAAVDARDWITSFSAKLPRVTWSS